MKRVIWLLVSLLLVNSSVAQGNESKVKIVKIHIGPSASNFINAEAPHKTFILSENHEVLIMSDKDLTINYDSHLFKDLRFNLAVGIGFEYYLKDDLSIYAALNYEGKGINLHSMSKVATQSDSYGDYPKYEEVRAENHSIEIDNNYLVLPITLRKYLNSQNTFYLQGGMYWGYLLKSEVDILLQKWQQERIVSAGLVTKISSNNFNEFHMEGEDEDKNYTSNVDYGLSIGTGINYPLSNRFYFNADLLINVGLRSIDKQNNNEYWESDTPRATGYYKTIHSANYYGLNSNAKNINAVITFGIGFRI